MFAFLSEPSVNGFDICPEFEENMIRGERVTTISNKDFQLNVYKNGSFIMNILGVECDISDMVGNYYGGDINYRLMNLLENMKYKRLNIDTRTFENLQKIVEYPLINWLSKILFLSIYSTQVMFNVSFQTISRMHIYVIKTSDDEVHISCYANGDIKFECNVNNFDDLIRFLIEFHN